jgi:hypothetical protein
LHCEDDDVEEKRRQANVAMPPRINKQTARMIRFTPFFKTLKLRQTLGILKGGDLPFLTY